MMVNEWMGRVNKSCIHEKEQQNRKSSTIAQRKKVLGDDDE